MWWNWQTRQIQNLLPKGVRVRVPPSPPILIKGEAMEIVATLGFLLISLLFVKHLVIDFVLQTPYQYTNKGIYGHPGGILHAGLHTAGTALVLYLLAPLISYPIWDYSIVVFWLSLMDGVIHYHMDWLKTQVCNKYNYKPSPRLGCTNNQATLFYWWLGLDQTVHNLTYVLISFLFWDCVL